VPTVRILLLAALLGILSAPATHAHEIEDNRAALVLRDQTHLSLTLYLRYTEAVHRALARGQSYGEFLLVLSAMTPEDFHRQMLRAQAKLQSGTRITLNGQQEVPITGWVWPDSARVQSLIRQQVMEATVGGGAHVHAEPLEVRADVTYERDITGASIQFAEELGKVLLVWYRASQIWVDARQPSPMVKFQ
jgi:hypothetical protein